ncbi:WD40-repeat-containing domain protein [Myxozyma melibiosi]|uniref:WD40-repeat-containing domain protein n=1 Tax=Myxozyma melibiosi TaxID=54550 RepID=A0ABR1FE93_9ASCO
MSNPQRPLGVGTPAAATPPPPTQYSAADLNRIVLEYLNKKGYSKTEQMLRIESATRTPAASVPGSPTPSGGHQDASRSATNGTVSNTDTLLKSSTDDPNLFIRAYKSLRDWIETSLDIFQPELRKLLFPIFVHTFFYLIQKPDSKSPATSLARRFFDTYSSDHSVLHGYDLQLLSGLTLPDHLQENETAKLYRQHKYRLNMSRTTFDLLLHFLDETENNGGPIIIRLINQYIETNVTPSRPDKYNDFSHSLGPDEGIPGHTTGQENRLNSQPVRLGRLPLDERMAKEVELRLKDEDDTAQNNNGIAGIGTTKTLLQEFHEMNQTEDSPVREVLPLPQYKGVDVEHEIAAVKDARSRLKIGPTEASLPSVCMYTFHNTYDGLNCLEFSNDSSLVAGGFSDSYLKIWSLKGEKLQSVVKGSQPLTSQRLVGHAGPVYGASFSPDGKYLLSCSEDKSARLWSMDTYTALVSYKGHSHPVWDVAFSPVGHYFATASHDQTARLWSCDHIYPLRIFAGHISDVDCVTFHPNSTYVLTGSSDKTCRMWDVAKGTPVRIMISHTAPVSAITMSPDGRTLASAADDGVIMLWDLGSGKAIKAMRGHEKGSSIYSLSFSREGSVLVSAGSDCSVRVWDVKGGSTTPSSTSSTVATLADSGKVLADGKAGDATAAGPAGGVAGSATGGAAGGSTAGGQSGDAAANAAKAGASARQTFATSDHMATFMTKRTPVYKVQFTGRNLCLAGGAFMGTS